MRGLGKCCLWIDDEVEKGFSEGDGKVNNTATI